MNTGPLPSSGGITSSVPSPVSASDTGSLSIVFDLFKGHDVMDAESLAERIVYAAYYSKKYGLGLRIYLSEDVANKVSNILLKFGIKIKIVSGEDMETPHILVDREGADVIVTGVDGDGNVVFKVRAPLSKFVDALRAIIMKTSTKKSKRNKRKRQEETYAEAYIPDSDLEEIEKKIKELMD